jgi:RNA polymerase sigma-70 factor, ECF subfamily
MEHHRSDAYIWRASRGLERVMNHFGTPSGEGPAPGPVEVAMGALEDEYASFEDFFAREGDRLFGLLVLVTGDRHEAEDLAQDAFVATWERWDRVRTVDNPAGYLHRTAMNAFRKRYRRAQILRRITGSVAGRPTAAPVDTSLELDETLRVLTPRQRAALVLTELLGYSASEAASTLGVKASTIGALKHQARTALKRESETADD